MPVTLNVIDHPLVATRLATLRRVETDNAAFRAALHELGTLLVYEAMRDAAVRQVPVTTPIQETTGTALAVPPLLVPILRAGLGFADAAQGLIPEASMGFVGLARDEETFSPTAYMEALPERLDDRPVIVLDPMIATGGSLRYCLELLAARGANDLTVISVLVAPEGIEALESFTGNLRIFTASKDERLNENAYIVPGLGDAGDRQFGPKD